MRKNTLPTSLLEKKDIKVNPADFKMKLRVQKLFSEAYEVPIPKPVGSHGGGDPLLQEQIFSHHPPPDPLGRNARHEQGAASLLVGAAANQSFVTGLPVKIDDLLRLNPKAKKLSELV
jgi:hypothetical protein